MQVSLFLKHGHSCSLELLIGLTGWKFSSLGEEEETGLTGVTGKRLALASDRMIFISIILAWACQPFGPTQAETLYFRHEMDMAWTMLDPRIAFFIHLFLSFNFFIQGKEKLVVLVSVQTKLKHWERYKCNFIIIKEVKCLQNKKKICQDGYKSNFLLSWFYLHCYPSFFIRDLVWVFYFIVYMAKRRQMCGYQNLLLIQGLILYNPNYSVVFPFSFILVCNFLVGIFSKGLQLSLLFFFS